MWVLFGVLILPVLLARRLFVGRRVHPTTTGVVRTSSINGLPKSALTIQIDGVDVQYNFLKSSDGFFTFIRPRIDAINEVTVSTATTGAESRVTVLWRLSSKRVAELTNTTAAPSGSTAIKA